MRPGRVRVRVPASSANLGPGFDALGIALELYAVIEMAPAAETTVTMRGGHMKGLPSDKSNLLYVTAQRLFAEAGVHVPELHIGMHSDIPLARGLGSSAAAIVGALGAANELAGSPFGRDDLFRMAAAAEGHPDNVGAALFGGVVSAVWDGARASCVRIEPPGRLTTLVAIPAYELLTHQARAALPEFVSRDDAVFNLSRASMLTAALATGQLQALSEAMRDRLHQPYRSPFVPGLSRVLREAPAHGALGAALSGAGPTAIAFVDEASTRKGELESFMREAMGAGGGHVETMWIRPSATGLEAIPVSGEIPESLIQGGAS